MELQSLFADVALALGGKLVAFEQLLGGSSANVWRLDIEADGLTESVVFRQHEPGELKDHSADIARKEHRLLQRLTELGLPVARPLYLDQANRFLVTEFVSGTTQVEPAVLPSAIEQMADLLVRIHALDVDDLVDDAGLAPLEDPIERLRTCMPSGPAGNALTPALDEVRVHQNPPVLMHGDYWPGNLLWAHGQIAALIDWEDAALGDPLADLACARVELLCQYGKPTMHRFTDRYLHATPDLDTRSLPVWECYVSATALTSMHLWGLDPAEETRRRDLTETFFNHAAESLTT